MIVPSSVGAFNASLEAIIKCKDSNYFLNFQKEIEKIALYLIKYLDMLESIDKMKGITLVVVKQLYCHLYILLSNHLFCDTLDNNSLIVVSVNVCQISRSII